MWPGWTANAQFAWNEAKIRQSVQMLEGYKTSLLLLVNSRAASDLIALRSSTKQLRAESQLQTETVMKRLDESDSKTAELLRHHSLELRTVTQVAKDSEISLRFESQQQTETVIKRIDESDSRMAELHNHRSAELTTALQSLSQQISTLSLTQTSAYDVSVEGDNLQSIIVPLQLMKSRLAKVLEIVDETQSLSVPTSKVDWFLSEMEDLTKYAYRSAASHQYSGIQKPGTLSFSLTHKISTVPVHNLGMIRSSSGFLVIEHVEGRDDNGSKIHRFRFACFATGIADLPPAGLAGLITSHDDGARTRISRQIRVLNIVPARSEAFRCARENNVARIMELFATGQASPLDFDEQGRSLLGISALYFQEEMVLFLLRAGCDPHLCRLGLGFLFYHRAEWLIDHNADIHIKDNAERTALDYAFKALDTLDETRRSALEGLRRIVTLLLEGSRPSDTPDFDLFSPGIK
ncbi:hypothetical protein OQA88_4240 [Cercophora sp. LCS_1]